MRVLLAEDDVELRGVLQRGLEEADYVVDAVADGEEALEYLRTYEYGVCIVDWKMPRREGIEVITWARAHEIQAPFLMLTARDTPPDRIRALDAGADDYLVKPFDYGELLARLRALLRRPTGGGTPVLSCGGVAFDPSTREATVEGEVVALTPREVAVLELLLRRAPSVVTRRAIALHAWPEEADAVGSNTIEVHVARLRSKLVGAAARIETVRGTGYRLAVSR